MDAALHGPDESACSFDQDYYELELLQTSEKEQIDSGGHDQFGRISKGDSTPTGVWRQHVTLAIVCTCLIFIAVVGIAFVTVPINPVLPDIIFGNKGEHIRSDEFTVDVMGAERIFTVRDEYVSYTVDSSYDRDFFITSFKSPRLRSLAALLSPAILRFGGTGNDYLVYQTGAEADCRPDYGPGYKGFVRECLNMTWWEDLVGFTQAAGAKLVLGLNVLYPITPVDEARLPDVTVWNSSNTRALLEYSVEHDLHVYGVELGNEENIRFSTDQTSRFIDQLAQLLEEIYPDPTTRPLIMGTDPHSFLFRNLISAKAYFDRLLPAIGHHLTAVTYHEYVGVQDPISSLDPAVYDRGLTCGQLVANVTQTHAAHAEVWSGETANKNQGGGGWGDTFGASLWYADSLGMKATLNHTIHLRQDFVGASYALVGRDERPRLGFYTALMAKRLLGRGVLAVNVTGDSFFDRKLRCYAFCHRASQSGGVVLLCVNLAADRPALLNATVSGQAGRRVEYHFTAPSLDSTTMFLNSEVVLGPGEANEPPVELPARPVEPALEDAVRVAASSYVYVVFHEAHAPACVDG